MFNSYNQNEPNFKADSPIFVDNLDFCKKVYFGF